MTTSWRGSIVPMEYNKDHPPGIGAPYLRINYGALPDAVKNSIGPEPAIVQEDDYELMKAPPDLDMD